MKVCEKELGVTLDVSKFQLWIQGLGQFEFWMGTLKIQYKHKNKVYKSVAIAWSEVSKENWKKLSNNINHWSTVDHALNKWRKLPTPLGI